MKPLFIVTLSAIVLLTVLRADDFSLNDGKTYTNCTVRRVEPDGILVMDSDGVRKLWFANLPAAVQKKYGFDAAKAGEYEQASKQAAIVRDNQIKADFKSKQAAIARDKAAVIDPTKCSVESVEILRVLPGGSIGWWGHGVFQGPNGYIEGMTNFCEGERVSFYGYRDGDYITDDCHIQKWKFICSQDKMTPAQREYEKKKMIWLMSEKPGGPKIGR